MGMLPPGWNVTVLAARAKLITEATETAPSARAIHRRGRNMWLFICGSMKGKDQGDSKPFQPAGVRITRSIPGAQSPDAVGRKTAHFRILLRVRSRQAKAGTKFCINGANC